MTTPPEQRDGRDSLVGLLAEALLRIFPGAQAPARCLVRLQPWRLPGHPNVALGLLRVLTDRFESPGELLPRCLRLSSPSSS